MVEANRDEEDNGPMRPPAVDSDKVTDVADSVADPGSVDPNRPIGFGEPGQAAAPGGEPVAPPGEEGGGRPVPPPGTEEGGNPDGPPAYHEQPPK